MNKNNNFTMIHIMSALMIIVGHMFVLLGKEPPVLFAGGWKLHEVGVGVLFMVSGYLTTLSYLRNRDKRFRAIRYLIKRLVRLYPSLIVCLLVTVIVLRLITIRPDVYWGQAKHYFINNVELKPCFYLAGVFETNIYPGAVNGSLWTLPVEMVCYCMLIPVMEIVLRLPKKGWPIVACVIMLAFSILFTFRGYITDLPYLIIWATDWLGATRLFMWFFIGVFSGMLEIRRFLHWQLAIVLVVLYVCLNGIVKQFAEPYVIGYIVMCLGEAENPMFAKLFKRDICYGLYLYAFPIQQLLVNVLFVRWGLQLPLIFYIALSIALTFIAGEVNYAVVEKNVSRLTRSL